MKNGKVFYKEATIFLIVIVFLIGIAWYSDSVNLQKKIEVLKEQNANYCEVIERYGEEKIEKDKENRILKKELEYFSEYDDYEVYSYVLKNGKEMYIYINKNVDKNEIIETIDEYVDSWPES